jgi:hypothetical protein
MWLPRMTTRRWMIAVGIVACALMAVKLAHRATRYRILAQHCETTVVHCQALMRYHRDQNRRDNAARELEYFKRLAVEYEGAARFPRILLAPEPPPLPPQE